jgi:hypothetical protein
MPGVLLSDSEDNFAPGTSNEEERTLSKEGEEDEDDEEGKAGESDDDEDEAEQDTDGTDTDDIATDDEQRSQGSTILEDPSDTEEFAVKSGKPPNVCTPAIENGMADNLGTGQLFMSLFL